MVVGWGVFCWVDVVGGYLLFNDTLLGVCNYGDMMVGFIGF